MNRAGGAEYRLRFGLAVRLPDCFDVQNREHHAFGIAQCNLAAARGQRFCKFFFNVQRDGHRPKNSAAEAHVVADALVIGWGHESSQGRESSAHEQFEIANLARGQIPRRPLSRMGFQFCCAFRRRHEIGKLSSMRRNNVAH